jgi:hypothetical protein
MGEERGFVDGPKPVVFGHDVQGSTSYRQFVTKDRYVLPLSRVFSSFDIVQRYLGLRL